MSRQRLVAVAEREEGLAGREAAHLLECHECRTGVAQLRALRETVAQRSVPEPSAELLQRILASRESGAKIILLGEAERPLPHADVGRALPFGALLAAAALFAAVLLSIDVRAGGAVGATGELRFRPGAPMVSDSVRITYRPGAMLSGHEQLVLRYRVRTGGTDGPSWSLPHRTLPLKRIAGGSYEATFGWPAQATLALFVVESSDGSVVDDRNARLWELLAHDVRGRPMYDALTALAVDLADRDWLSAVEVTRRMTDLHPEQPGAWQQRIAMELTAVGEAARDSLLTGFRPLLLRLDATLDGRSTSSADAFAMFVSFDALADSTRAAIWRHRLATLHPRSSEQASLLTGDAVVEGGRTHATMTRLDSIWRTTDPTFVTAHWGVQIARRLQDTTALRLWLERLDSLGPTAAGVGTRTAGGLPSPSRYVEGRLRGQLRRYAVTHDSARWLGNTRDQQLHANRWHSRWYHARLGEQMLLQGRHEEGLAHLRDAADIGWDLPVLRSLASELVKAGRVLDADRYLSRAAVHPLADPFLRDTLLSSIVDQDPAALLREAEGALRDAMLTTATSRPPRGTATLRDSTGRAHDFPVLRGKRPTLVVFLSRLCEPSRLDLPLVAAAAPALAARGVNVIGVTEERFSPELRDFLAEQRLPFPVYHDPDNALLSAFGLAGTPYYVLLDEWGIIRFSQLSPDALALRGTALSLASTGVADAAVTSDSGARRWP